MIKQFFIDLLAWVTILSSLLVIISVNPVISIIYLILVFCGAAGFLMLIGIPFMGLSYIILYVGAITVLFLFIIMMFNIKLSDIVNTQDQRNAIIAFILAITGLFIYLIKWIIPFSLNDVAGLPKIYKVDNALFNNTITYFNNVWNTVNPNNADITFMKFLQIEALGEGLYTYNSSLLIICSMILLLAMIAPIFISGKFKH